MQNKIIGFCYFYIIGVALGMFYLPADPALATLCWGGVAVLLALVVGLGSALAKTDQPTLKRQALFWLVMLLAGASMGYARYFSRTTVPDIKLGTIQAQADQLVYQESAPMRQPGLLAVRVKAPPQQQIVLKVHGTLQSLQPALNAEGTPRMDAEGRWIMNQTPLTVVSDPVVIPADAAPNALVPVMQPFSKIEKIEFLAGAGGDFTIIQKPNRVATFSRAGRTTVPVTILGKIMQDPWIYSFKTVLFVTPYFIQYYPNGPFLPVDRGNVQVSIDPKTPGYAAFATSDAYGYDVILKGEMTTASGRINPGGFDQRKYLLNIDTEARVRTRSSLEDPAPIKLVRPEGGPLRRGNWLVEFSLTLRDDITRVYKKTMPYPNSAFLGGVGLGLRYGLADTETVASGEFSDSAVKPLFGTKEGENELIANEFKISGINHVLAVSGLHVTIITALFVGIGVLLRLHRKAYVPLIVFALIIFAIVTGARPSTMRAVIMNSLFLLTWAYLEQSLRSSVLLGVPVAAFIILLQNPCMAVDPSFTLSFGAILSLALLTQPFYDILKRLRGNDLVAFLIVISALTWAFAAQWLLVTTWRFWGVYAVFGAAVFFIGRLLAKAGVRLIGERGFSDLPQGVAIFLAAQFGIQVGMMIPLSPFYFYRWPVAGAYANLIAIPLIGVVLQVGILAGVLGLIPGVGFYLALLLNASNWIFSTLFILIGHYFSEWFSYPFISKMSLGQLAFYYCLCALFVWQRSIREWLVSLPVKGRWAVGGVAAIILMALAGCVGWGRCTAPRDLKVTVLAASYGSAIVVQMPDGQSAVLDTGFVHAERRRNEAERTLLPFLCSIGLRTLDALILTAPVPERQAGAATVITHQRIKTVYVAPGMQDSIANGEVGALLAKRQPSLITKWANTVVRTEPLAPGAKLLAGEKDGKEFYIEVLAAGTEAKDAAVLRLVYGDFAMLLPSELTLPQQKQLVATAGAGQLRAQVLVMPARGVAGLELPDETLDAELPLALEDATLPLLKAVQPQWAVFEFGNPRPVLGDQGRKGVQIHNRTRRLAEDYLDKNHVLVTDQHGAIYIQSDGKTFTLDTQAQRNVDAAVSDADMAHEMEIGL